MIPYAAAAGAILLWSALAALGLSLAHLPPFLLTGCALVLGALPGLMHWRQWRVPASTLLLGVGGLFGFHFLLFLALRLAPPVEANLVNYLWPLLIVLLSPVLLRGMALSPRHVAAALLGFAGAALAIGAAPATLDGSAVLGFALAGGSAAVWACYSLLVRRVPPFSSWAIGGFALASGLLALGCHVLFEPRAAFLPGDGVRLALLGLGPMGAAFYLWDIAMKRGDPRVVGVLAYATPVLSTLLLIWTTWSGARPAAGARRGAGGRRRAARRTARVEMAAGRAFPGQRRHAVKSVPGRALAPGLILSHDRHATLTALAARCFAWCARALLPGVLACPRGDAGARPARRWPPAARCRAATLRRAPRDRSRGRVLHRRDRDHRAPGRSHRHDLAQRARHRRAVGPGERGRHRRGRDRHRGERRRHRAALRAAPRRGRGETVPRLSRDDGQQGRGRSLPAEGRRTLVRRIPVRADGRPPRLSLASTSPTARPPGA